MNFSTVAFITAGSLWTAAAASAWEPPFPIGPQQTRPALFDGDGGNPQQDQEALNRAFQHAVNYLASLGDPEAMDIVKQAQENNNNIQISIDQAKSIVDRAAKVLQGGGKLDQPAAPGGQGETKDKEEIDPTTPPFPPDEERLKKAITQLNKKNDPEAKQIIEDFKKTKTLDVPDDQAWAIVGRAVKQGLIKAEKGDPDFEAMAAPKDDPAAKEAAAAKAAAKKRAEEAVVALSKKGDKEARAVIDRARRNRDDMQLTDDEAKEFIDRAVAKDLIEAERVGGPAEPQRMHPQQLLQIAQRLEQQGDRTAKRILRDHRKTVEANKTPDFTKEEEKEIVERGKKAGLL